MSLTFNDIEMDDRELDLYKFSYEQGKKDTLKEVKEAIETFRKSFTKIHDENRLDHREYLGRMFALNIIERELGIE